MPETLHDQMPPPGQYPHHMDGPVTAGQVAAHLARYPDMYPPVLDHDFKANGIPVDRSAGQHGTPPYSAADEIPPFEGEAIQTAEKNVGHNWDVIAAQPHTPEHRMLETEIGRDISPGFDALPTGQQEAITVTAELGDMVVPAPQGRQSRMARFFRRKNTQRSDSSEQQPLPTELTTDQRINGMVTGLAQSASGNGEDLAGTTKRRIGDIADGLASIAESGEVMGPLQRSAILNLAYAAAGDAQRQLLSETATADQKNNALSRLTDIQYTLSKLDFKYSKADEYTARGEKVPKFQKQYYRERINVPEDAPFTDLDLHGVLAKALEMPDETSLDGALQADPPTRRILTELAAGSHQRGEANHTLRLLRTVKDKRYFMTVAEGVFGENALEWPKQDIADTEIKQLLTHPSFTKHAIGYMSAKAINRPELYDSIENDVLLEKLQLPQTLVTDLKTSLLLRRGKDSDKYALKLQKLLERCQNPERTKAVYEMFGVVNFDRYTEAQLNRDYAVARGNQEVIRVLQGNDVTLFDADALQDHNGFADNTGGLLEALEGADTTLVAEADGLASYGFHLLRLNQLGIMPSTFGFKAHGMPGSFQLGKGSVGVGLRGQEEPTFDIESPEIEPRIKRFIEKYMQPGPSGEKNVIALSCSLARSGTDGEPSLMERAAQITGATTWGAIVPVGVGASSPDEWGNSGIDLVPMIEDGKVDESLRATPIVRRFTPRADGTVTSQEYHFIGPTALRPRRPTSQEVQ